MMPDNTMMFIGLIASIGCVALQVERLAKRATWGWWDLIDSGLGIPWWLFVAVNFYIRMP